VSNKGESSFNFQNYDSLCRGFSLKANFLQFQAQILLVLRYAILWWEGDAKEIPVIPKKGALVC
jgi:hypothetical protein